MFPNVYYTICISNKDFTIVSENVVLPPKSKVNTTTKF